MNRNDNSSQESLESVEHLLERYVPVGPPAALRERVLNTASFVSQRRPRRIAVYLWRAAVAAGLIAAIWLNTEAERISSRVAGQVGVGPALWTQQDEQFAHDLNGDGWGRRYLAMGLRAGPLNAGVPQTADGDF